MYRFLLPAHKFLAQTGLLVQSEHRQSVLCPGHAYIEQAAFFFVTLPFLFTAQEVWRRRGRGSAGGTGGDAVWRDAEDAWDEGAV